MNCVSIHQVNISSVQFSCSVVSNSLRPHEPQHWSPGLPVHHQLLEFTQTYVHWVSDAIQPSHPLWSPSRPAFNLSQHQGLFKWVSSSHQVAKVLEFQLQHQSFQWIFMKRWWVLRLGLKKGEFSLWLFLSECLPWEPCLHLWKRPSMDVLVEASAKLLADASNKARTSVKEGSNNFTSNFQSSSWGSQHHGMETSCLYFSCWNLWPNWQRPCEIMHD